MNATIREVSCSHSLAWKPTYRTFGHCTAQCNTIPGFCVDAVVHLPHGAHPSQCYGCYDYDNPFYVMYDKASKTQED